MEFDVLSRKVIGCAIEVHKHIGPGLLESAYEQCLGYELRQNGIAFARQVPLPVEYKDMRLDCGYRADLVLDDQLVVELKSVDKLQRIHEAQLLTYMKIAKIHTGLLINFNVNLLKSGIKRFVL
jgi:GxxExxY protein